MTYTAKDIREMRAAVIIELCNELYEQYYALTGGIEAQTLRNQISNTNIEDRLRTYISAEISLEQLKQGM